MNPVEYEVINKPINRSKTWINTKYHCVYSREIPAYKKFAIAKKFNPIDNEYDYYIILSNDLLNETITNNVILDEYGRTKLHIDKNSWNTLGFDTYHNDSQIDVTIVEKDDNYCSVKLNLF